MQTPHCEAQNPWEVQEEERKEVEHLITRGFRKGDEEAASTLTISSRFAGLYLLYFYTF